MRDKVWLVFDSEAVGLFSIISICESEEIAEMLIKIHEENPIDDKLHAYYAIETEIFRAKPVKPVIVFSTTMIQ